MAPTLSKPSKPVAPKDHSLTNLRTALTVLTILHHTAIPYGGLGSWPYTCPHHQSASSPILVAFNAINQSFFMGTFFYLSGLLTAQSLKRKKPEEFLRSRWWRLGVPCAAYSMFAPPAQTLIMNFSRHRTLSSYQIQHTFTDHIKTLRSVHGPLWFNSLLLVFDTIDALFLPQFQKLKLPLNFTQTMTLNILANFLVRIPFPLGSVYTPLSLQLGYVPQYIFSYILGSRSTTTSTHHLTNSQRRWLLTASISSGAVLVGLLCFFPDTYSLENVQGGINIATASYAIWNETTGYLISTYLLDLFKRKEVLKRQWRNFGQYQYAAFLVHPVVLVGVQSFSERWRSASGVLNVMIVGTIGVVGSWGVGWFMTKSDLLGIC